MEFEGDLQFYFDQNITVNHNLEYMFIYNKPQITIFLVLINGFGSFSIFRAFDPSGD